MDSSDEDYQDASHHPSISEPPSTSNPRKPSYREEPQHAPVPIPDYSDEEEEMVQVITKAKPVGKTFSSMFASKSSKGSVMSTSAFAPDSNTAAATSSLTMGHTNKQGLDPNAVKQVLEERKRLDDKLRMQQKELEELRKLKEEQKQSEQHERQAREDLQQQQHQLLQRQQELIKNPLTTTTNPSTSSTPPLPPNP
ncbi:hypothetical protein TrRE_jg12876 [Triparma retinervis]|uniref:Uncharacterized protein n=1 Tax=Triparma retinervis TaxID=2557542 RepID=A0A9W7FEL4_9STRA|nr:hypothetical protein TrRE_jg12876 [Triparma retinervis]